MEMHLPAPASTALAERLTRKIPVNEHVETPPMIGGGDKEGPSSEEGDMSADDSVDKLFPVFYKSHQAKTRDILKTESPKTGTPSSYPKISLPAKSTDGLEQLVIDAGQKSLAPSTCPECGFYYMSGDPDEKRMHLKYHNSSKPAIRHTGWKWERVAAKFPDGLVVHVCPSDPKPWWSKIELILETANQDLGISFASQLSKHAHAYFYVSNQVVVGCVIVEPIRVAYRMLEVDRKELERVKEPGDKIAMEAPSFCSNTPVRGSRCGINRIWTCPSERRKGVATKMLDAVRATFVYGHILKLSEIAFSDPTPMGMSLAVKYTKSTNFLVYKAIKD
ncbi:N-acetyltransferase ESCO2 [Hetaerina americana]|uniref:N-acetyltransferase ESCO2 n=1 Tax=Hetaerina americana TaxID=62018 RepID=UPI003A7F3FD3